MKRIILFSLLLVILTGCECNYQLEFKDDKLIENVELVLPSSEKDKIKELEKSSVYAIYNSMTNQPYIYNYDKGLINFTANYSYTYTPETFNQALYANDCFDAFSFVSQGNNYILSTSEGFKCMSLDYHFLDSLKLQVKTNHVVLEHNADEVKEGNYIWNINNNNAENKRIYVKFGEVEERNFFEKILDFIKENKLTVIITTILVLGVGITISTIVIISKKNNEI